MSNNPDAQNPSTDPRQDLYALAGQMISAQSREQVIELLNGESEEERAQWDMDNEGDRYDGLS
jgi:hypothetical protein